MSRAYNVINNLYFSVPLCSRNSCSHNKQNIMRAFFRVLLLAVEQSGGCDLLSLTYRTMMVIKNWRRKTVDGLMRMNVFSRSWYNSSSVLMIWLKSANVLSSRLHSLNGKKQLCRRQTRSWMIQCWSFSGNSVLCYLRFSVRNVHKL